jgi:signal transduction histidine kinase
MPGIIVNISIKDELEETVSDVDRLRMILNNLISNAFKFKKLVADSTHTIDIQVDLTGNNFRIEVRDNGIGIEKQHIDNIFRMFYRANDKKSGSGLGLYIAREAAKRINCDLEVNSTYGVGTSMALIRKL